MEKPTVTDVLGVPLVIATRGGVIENVHGGHAAVVSADGAIMAEAGNASVWTYMRSTAKPVQALPAIMGGVLEAYGLGDDAVALMCASHQGTPAHIAVLERMLAQTGVREEQLVFAPQLPANLEARDEVIRRGGQPRKLYHVCAGKHIGMLALCKVRGWPMETYAEREHPLQQELLRTVAALADLEPEAVGCAIDGCGLPVFALPLWRLALIYARFAAWDAAAADGGPDSPVAAAPTGGAMAAAAGRIAAAMRRHPALVEGPGRLASAMLGDGNVVAKSGAQGVFVFALGREGIAGVVKLADGTETPWPEAVCAMLAQMGLGRELIARIRQQIPPEMRNDAGQVTGRREPCLELRRNIGR
ncbi:asparaginase [Paenibacillus lycopersici]|uniref:Asparaginase n=1 Tax=Paenibacillus lycopersici TaxID=2704462 RepID=A0A6C0FV83_9BACL|nr:asparaginase [Paenibacillus lycopersici]QHT59942.1 asparaginase [Paenibacillus lycopersici]